MAFVKNVLATLVGIFVFFFISIFIFGGVIAALSEGDQVSVNDKTVLYFNMTGAVTEVAPEESIEELVFGDRAIRHGVINIIQTLDNAKTDDRIRGVYLEHGGIQASTAAISELREALIDFKSSGKFVYSFSEIYSEKDYYLASVADKIYLHPEGMMEFNGISANVMFLKGAFDKLGIEPEIFRVGEYKSAIETFIRKDLSKENREQTEALISSIQKNIIIDIAETRNIDKSELENISNKMLVKFPEEAEQYKLVDALSYEDQVKDQIRERLSIGSGDKIEFLSYMSYQQSLEEQFSSNRIAVVVAEGEIVMGHGNEEQIGAHEFVKELQKVRENDRVRAVVVRINSPGGSALASDIIWRELELIKAKKPLIASMSGVAASGGYYMAAAADTILALPSTITGSIGVFGLMANFGVFLEDKLGITFDQVNTGELSDFPNLTRPLTTIEREIFQQGVNKVYDTFLSKVDDGRPIDREQVEAVAKGRVWSGEQAIDKGLVDQLGGLNEAIILAAKAANISEDYMMVVYPEPKTKIEQFLESLEEGAGAKILKNRLGVMAPYVDKINELKNFTGVQARMPFEISID